eukprot:1162042-Pelagomonas_calceolata.AAC.4
MRRTLLPGREARWRSATRPRKCARQAGSKREVLKALRRPAPHPGILVLLTYIREDLCPSWAEGDLLTTAGTRGGVASNAENWRSPRVGVCMHVSMLV